MRRNYFQRNVYGITEELLNILLWKYNKFKINSLFLKEENIIEVGEINKLKSNYSLDKFKGKIIKEDNHLICQRNYYLTHLCKFFGFKINYISLLYIFDEDTQKELKKPNEKSGSKYCIRHKIDFLEH